VKQKRALMKRIAGLASQLRRGPKRLTVWEKAILWGQIQGLCWAAGVKLEQV